MSDYWAASPEARECYPYPGIDGLSLERVRALRAAFDAETRADHD